MKIGNAKVQKIFDSRAEETIRVSLTIGKHEFSSAIPAGKSVSENEVKIFDFKQAGRILKKTILPKLRRKNFSTSKNFDSFLLSLDPTPNKKQLGGNLLLGLSQAFVRALAHERGEAAWQVLNREYFKSQKLKAKPLIFSNFINGGAHARNSLSIQEYLVIAKPNGGLVQAAERLRALFAALGQELEKLTGLKNIPIGDECGYSLDFADNFEPLKILEKLILRHKLQKYFGLGIDSAASNFYSTNGYQFENRKYSTKQLLDVYLNYFSRSKLLSSIEDPFDEEDYLGFKHFVAKLLKKNPKAWIVGDDLTSTDAKAISSFANQKMINAVIIKPNQIGTVKETCEAILAARLAGAKVIVSHRSGETDDQFIIQLSRGSNADGVKIGPPAHERIFKFNELLALYD